MNNGMLYNSGLITLGDDLFHRLWFKTPANSALGRDSDQLYMFIFWVSVISFIVVIGLMLAFTLRYRRGAKTGYQTSVGHNTALELAWSIIPLLVMVVIFFWGFNGFVRKLIAPANAEEIRVTGQRWNWSFKYSNGREPMPEDYELVGNKSSPIMVVPVGKPVKLILSSTDVIHSFFIRSMRSKMDVFPNRYTSFWFQADQVGMYEILCAEYCGQDHSEMAAWLKVVPIDEFIAWKGKEPNLPPVEMGKYLYKARGCVACHTLDGKAGTGPSWKNIFGRAVEFADGTGHSAADMSDAEKFSNYVRESVYTPSAKIVKGYANQMNSFQGQLKPAQLEAIIAFMRSPELSDKAPPPDPATAPAGGAAPSDKPTPSAPPAPPAAKPPAH